MFDLDAVSSGKWAASGILHTGFGKQFLGSLTYYPREQA